MTCPECSAGYRRIELVSQKGNKGKFHCLMCNHLLEVFDGSTQVALRLTVQPEKSRDDTDKRFSNWRGAAFTACGLGEMRILVPLAPEPLAFVVHLAH